MSTGNSLRIAQRSAVQAARDALALPGARSRSRAGLLGLGGVLVSAAVLVMCAAHTNAILPESVRPIPPWMAGVFAHAGVDLGSVGLVTVLALNFIAYAVATSCADRLSGRAVLGSIAALNALVLLAPPLVSTDVFSYQAYARMFAIYGVNPYVHGPYAIALDPVYPFIGADWVNIGTAYGPLFTALSALLAPLAIAAAVVAYKGLAAVASLAIVALVWNTARLRGLDPVRAVALVGLNPLFVIYGVGGGHNDLLMVLAMAAAVCFLVQRRERAGGASIALAAGLKLTGILLAPYALAGLAGARERARRRELLLGFALATAGIAALTFALFGTGSLHLLGTLRQSQSTGNNWHSIPGFISTRLGLGTIGHVTGWVLAGLFVIVAAWLLRRVWRQEMGWIEGAAWTTAAMIATASSLLPWYIAWLLPLAAVGRDRRLTRVALGLSGLITFIDLLGYIPHASSVLGL